MADVHRDRRRPLFRPGGAFQALRAGGAGIRASTATSSRRSATTGFSTIISPTQPLHARRYLHHRRHGVLGLGAHGAVHHGRRCASRNIRNVKRLLDEIYARPAAAAREALKDKYAFKTEMDDEARQIMFRHTHDQGGLTRRRFRIAGQGTARLLRTARCPLPPRPKPPRPSFRSSCPAAPARACGRSRARAFPKQLWPLISERSLMQETALRAVGPGFAPPIVVCNQEHRFLIAEQMRARRRRRRRASCWSRSAATAPPPSPPPRCWRPRTTPTPCCG